MKITHLSKNKLVPAIWDGGETFEYFIYPAKSSYAKRDFLFRISSANIAKVPSDFTRFEKYQRFLVMLDNDLELVRNGKNEHYKENEVFTFCSNDEIVSQSLGNDFNLMVRNENVSANVFFTKDSQNLNNDFLFVFAKNETEIILNEQRFSINPFDLLLIENNENKSVQFGANQNVILGCLNLKK